MERKRGRNGKNKQKAKNEEESIKKQKVEEQVTRNKAGLISFESLQQITKRLKQTPAASNWKKVFSLRTEKSCGIGEYLDMLPLIDWCHMNSFGVIQVLPLNDTNPDNSPFSPISSFSMNPALISLRELPYSNDSTDSMKNLLKELDSLNSAERVQWKEVKETKRKYMREYFQSHGDKICNTENYKNFLVSNQYWINNYSLFCMLKENHSWESWEKWPQEFSKEFSEEELQELSQRYSKEISFYSFQQYLCHHQMIRVKKYAEQKGVLLKGDIPFLVSRDSSDVWAHRNFFDLSKSAGAPPDLYSDVGQDWGLPLYNWDNLQKEDYSWWKNRLAVASQYFHIYRIDHIVGFYRVWGVPMGKKPTEGSFHPEDQSQWIPQGEKILRIMLESSQMLPIGEDLGAVPNEVRINLQKLGICGTKVVRWERLWDQEGKPFMSTDEYNVDSMTTVSTHDSETLALWWTKLREESKTYCEWMKWEYEDLLDSKKREEILKQSHESSSLFHINLLPEYLALDSSLIHKDMDMERINIPGKLLDTNWSYRMVPTIEQLEKNKELSNIIARIVKT